MFVRGGLWYLPTSNHSEIVELRALISSIPIGNSDSIEWAGQSRHVCFSTFIQSIRLTAAPPDWIKAIWRQLSIPKCSFTLWIALKNRLLTKE